MTNANIFEVRNSQGNIIAIFRPKAVMNVYKSSKKDKIVVLNEIKGVWNSGNNDNAEINLTQKTIRIFGTVDTSVYTVKKAPSFDRVFKIGEIVEVGSYNLTYTGAIRNITKSYVEVEYCGRAKRMKLSEFIYRNWDLNLAKIAKSNSEWYD